LIDCSWCLQFFKQMEYCELRQAVWVFVIQSCNWYNFSFTEWNSVLYYTCVFGVSIGEHIRCFLFHTHTFVTVEKWHYVLQIISCLFVKTHACANVCDRELSAGSFRETRYLIRQSSVLLQKERWNSSTSVFPWHRWY
jgi:hypothetical protein